MAIKDDVLAEFALYQTGLGGIGTWLTPDTPQIVFDRLGRIDVEPMTREQLVQLLALSHEAPMSLGFFHYYWLEAPAHPYDVKAVCQYESAWHTDASPAIGSRAHLRWGLHRLFMDGLLYFGNVRTAYRELRSRSLEELRAFFRTRMFETERLRVRGPALDLSPIAKDDRYLISEMACKSHAANAGETSALRQILVDAWGRHSKAGGGRVRIRDLLDGTKLPAGVKDRQAEFLFSADDILDQEVESEGDVESKYAEVAEAFQRARTAALRNTDLYLSMAYDLDVYVATSMRTRDNFRNMASTCDTVFRDARLAEFNLRYFDPTLSAADGHEDKGLIECLMVKCAKVLVYCAGDKDSFGKDAEAAMALSLGKPVIHFCDADSRMRIFKDVHPLSRLIDFSSGVAVGTIVTSDERQVAELLLRTFSNTMLYELDHHPERPGYLRLREKLTGSVVRLQTNNQLLAETFWNLYRGS